MNTRFAMLSVAFIAMFVGVLGGIAVGPALGVDWDRGDIDCSGDVNSQDALQILRYDAGVTTQLPVGCPPIGPTPTGEPTQTAEPTQSPGNLPPPIHVGPIAAGGLAQVTISNDSPHALTLEFEGAETRNVSMDECPTCIEYFVPPFFCPEKGPQEVVLLEPGTYTVTVHTDDPDIGSYRGEWELDGNQAYFSCFIIVKSFGSSWLDVPRTH